MSIKLYGSAVSTYTRSARMVLHEKGLAYHLLAAKMRDPAYTSLHPWLKMPALDHDGFVLYESTAILRYVDEAFDGPALQPADARGRARVAQWMSAYNDYVAPKAVRGVLIPRFVLQPRGMDVDNHAIARAAASARDALKRFDAALEEMPYLAGDAPSLADWLLAPTVAADALLEMDDQYAAGLENVEAWLERMKARPSFAATEPAP